MKKLHKALMGIAALAMAATFTAFAGCGGGNEAVIKGDYTEVSAENPSALTEALSEVKADKLLGDMTAEDFQFGLEVSSSNDVSFKYGDWASASANVKAGYKVVLNSEMEASGIGDASVSYKLKVNEKGAATLPFFKEAINTSGSAKATSYVDGSYVYGEVDLTKIGDLPGVTDDMKVVLSAKVDYTELLGAFDIGGLIPMTSYIMGPDGYIDEDISGAIEEDKSESDDIMGMLMELVQNPAEAVAALAQYKITLGLDTKDGIKIKVAADEESVWAILGTFIESADAMSTIKSACTFKKCKIEVYFAIDANGMFSQASTLIDIDVKYDMAKMMGVPDNAEVKPPVISASVSCSEVIKVYNGDVTVPTGLSAETKYIDMTGTIAGLIGQGK